jgi:hypothetical protein
VPSTSAKVWEVFAAVRRVTIFGLGVWVIIAGLADPESQNTVSLLVIGMVMVGVLPIDNLLAPLRRRDRQPVPVPAPVPATEKSVADVNTI